MKIRPLTRSDREPVLALLDSTEAFQPHEIAVALELMDVALNKPGQQDYFPYVLEDGPTVMAYACFGKNPMTQSTYDLYWLATRRQAMRKGYGRALFAFVENEIRQRGGRLLVIETSSKESYQGTQSFYTQVGCQFAAALPDFYDVGDDRVIYFKRLVETG
ncbi:MAG: GNAT family N-acetyltransferase [Verrucomicrobiota bacterium]